jgi:hypothetical protein
MAARFIEVSSGSYITARSCLDHRQGREKKKCHYSRIDALCMKRGIFLVLRHSARFVAFRTLPAFICRVGGAQNSIIYH